MTNTFKLTTKVEYLSEDNMVVFGVAYNLQQLALYTSDKNHIAEAEKFFKEISTTSAGIIPRRFIIVCPDVCDELAEVLLGFEVQHVCDFDVATCKHFNYYPARRSLVLTHEQVYPVNKSKPFLNNPEFVKAFTHTFKSLGQLVGAPAELMDKYL